MIMIGWRVVGDVITVAACIVRGGSLRSADSRAAPDAAIVEGAAEGVSVRL